MHTLSIDIERRHLDAAALEANCTRPDIIKRIEAMYRANLHEDLKWVTQDIQEVGV